MAKSADQNAQDNNLHKKQLNAKQFQAALTKITTKFDIANIYCKLSFGSLSNECIKTGTARSRFLSLINIILDQKELKVNNKSPIFFSRL